MRRARRGIVCSLLVLVLVLAACTSNPDDGGSATTRPDGDRTAMEEDPAAHPPDEVAATTTLHLDGSDVDVDVYPLVRAGEHVVLTLDLHREDAGKDTLLLSGRWSGTPVLRLPAMAGLRLFDLERDVVHTVATDGDHGTITTGRNYIALDRGESMRLQTAFAAPPAGTDSLGLFTPGGPYVEAVPVVEGEVPSPALPGTPSADDDATEPLDLSLAAEAPVVPLESYTRELDGAVQTLTTTEELQVTLGADVLFEFDSADLSDQAHAALDAAAAHLSGREPGTVHVVGHTDDLASDAYNQDLSERRAGAVASALGERIDTGRFELRPEGRGKHEPLVPNADDEARAMNRRVTLTLVSEITETVEVTTAGELPPFEGPVETGADGVQVTTVGTYRFRAPEARRVDGHLVVDLEVTAVDERAEVGVGFLDPVWHYRGAVFTVQRSAAGLVVLRGGTAVYPLDHLHGVSADGHEQWLPATDLETLGPLAPGATRSFSVIYPDVGDLDEVAVQVSRGLGAEPFRLTDIPVR